MSADLLLSSRTSPLGVPGFVEMTRTEGISPWKSNKDTVSASCRFLGEHLFVNFNDLLMPFTGAGGKLSTRLPPGRLVEHLICK